MDFQVNSYVPTDSVEIKTLWDTKINIPTPVPLASGQENQHFMVRLQKKFIHFVKRHLIFIRRTVAALCLVAYLIYVTFAIQYNVELAKPVIICSVCIIAIILYVIIRDKLGEFIWTALKPMRLFMQRRERALTWFAWVAVATILTDYLVLEVLTTWRQVQSLIGMIFFLFVPWITCKHPNKIRWRPVVWGLGLQFCMGILVLRWKPGYNAVKWLSQKINTVIFYSVDGAAGAFGDPTLFLHPFLMLVVPLVIYVGVVIALFYHFGWIQNFARSLGWLVDKTMETTAIESISIAVNIFLSVLDTVIMLKPYLLKLTPSEFHCFLVGAHSTIAGFAFGLFVVFGVKPQHILTGAVMSAPAAIAVAKLNWPEVDKSYFKGASSFELGDGGYNNVFDALAKGAWEAGKTALVILIQVLVFMALLKFMDDMVFWFGIKVGLELTLGGILSYIFYPLAYVIGIDIEDIPEVSNMLGIKLVANEFLAFIRLGKYERAGLISERSQAIATYAMCGFSSFGTLVIFSGVWNQVSPGKTKEAIRLIPRIMMNANVACFLTACIAGIFYNEDVVNDSEGATKGQIIILNILEVIPGYRELSEMLGFSY